MPARYIDAEMEEFMFEFILLVKKPTANQVWEALKCAFPEAKIPQKRGINKWRKRNIPKLRIIKKPFLCEWQKEERRRWIPKIIGSWEWITANVFFADEKVFVYQSFGKTGIKPKKGLRVLIIIVHSVKSCRE